MSGVLVFPQKQSEDVKEMEKNFSAHIYKRPSHSGPLVPGSVWAKGGKEVDDVPPASNRENLSKLSGLVASRTLLSEDQEDKSLHLHHKKPIEVRKSAESTNGSESRRRQDQKRFVDLNQIESRRVPAGKSTPVSCFFVVIVIIVIFFNSFCFINSIFGCGSLHKASIRIWILSCYMIDNWRGNDRHTFY